MNLIDTHAHIDQLTDLDIVMQDCVEKGVTGIVAMSVDLDSMYNVLNIAKRFQAPRVYPALGVHPGKVSGPDAQDFDRTMQFIKDQHENAIAIGETGLDYWYKWVRSNHDERAKQHRFFEAQLHLAREYDLPIVIHSRGAWRDCLAMTKAAGVTKALFHWYSGPVDKLAEIIEAGYYVSTSVSVGYSVESRTAMTAAPIDRILIETDSPVTYKEGEDLFSSKPYHVALTAKHLAALKGLDLDETLRIVNNNAVKFFGIT